MTRDDIIKLAQKCQLIGMRPHLDGIYQESLERFAALVIEATEPKRQIYEAYEKGREMGMIVEREARAKVCESFNSEPVASGLAQSGSIKPASNPGEWQGLTDEEIRTVFALCRNGSLHELARAIEAKLKEKNNG